MDLLKLPYEVLLKIFLEIKNIKSLSVVNSRFNDVINGLYEVFITKFNDLVTDWESNVKTLIEILITADDVNSIKFLYNNYLNLLLDNNISISYILFNALVEQKQNIINWALNEEDFNDFDSLICMSSLYGNFEITLWAYENGAKDLNCVIINSIQNNYEELLKWSLNKYKNKFILFAIENNKINDLELLLTYGYITANEIGIVAAKNGYTEIVNFALINGANNIENISKEAIKNGYIDTVTFLLDNDLITPNEASYLAAKYGYLDIVKLAFKYGATNSNEVTKNGAKYGYLDIVKYGFKMGANNESEVRKIAKRHDYYNIANYAKKLINK